MSCSILGYFLSKSDFASTSLFVLSQYSDTLSKAESYSTWINDTTMTIFDFIKLGILPSVLLYKMKEDDYSNFFCRCFVIGECILLLFHPFKMIQRAVVGCIIFGCVCLPCVYKKPTKFANILPWVVLLYYVYTYTRSIRLFDPKTDLSEILPYTFIFQ